MQFMLAYHGGIDVWFTQNMTIEDRNYFAELLIDEKKREEKSYKKSEREGQMQSRSTPHRPYINPRIKI